MFAKEDQPLLGVCRTANLPMLEILVLLAAGIARWRGADSIRSSVFTGLTNRGRSFRNQLVSLDLDLSRGHIVLYGSRVDIWMIIS